MHEINKIKTDILFLHAPAYYDFRKEDKVFFPFLGTSGDVPVSPVYEIFPMGFLSLRDFLSNLGHDVRILNLASLMLQYPRVNVETLLQNIDARIIGIDLHWLIHVQGSLEIAALLKKLHPETYILFGGISANYYAKELITYKQVDLVMRGYDTHQAMNILLESIKTDCNLLKVPNLCWKDDSGNVHINKMDIQDSFICNTTNWENAFTVNKQTKSIAEINLLTSVGCKYNCGWCGGSNDAIKKIYSISKGFVPKCSQCIDKDLENVNKITDKRVHLYFNGAYCNTEQQIKHFINQFNNEIKSVNYEQFFLPSEDILREMVMRNCKTTITLSPESHDFRISKLAGRGVYSMEEMERWIDKALNIGIHEIDIWFFIGMPYQDEKSVFETLDYCEKLMKRFQGKLVIPSICSMMPILDPGSNFFENPEKYGYYRFCNTLSDHLNSMNKASLINRLNYETKWLSRKDIVNLGYITMARLFEMKADMNLIPNILSSALVKALDESIDFINVLYDIENIKNERESKRELHSISNEIKRRNSEVFSYGFLNQTFPMARKAGGRYIDQLLWDDEILKNISDNTQ